MQQNEIGTEKHNVIIIDGTWSQAKNMFLKNSLFHLPKQVYSYLGISLEKEVVNQIKGVNQAKNNSSQLCTVVSVTLSNECIANDLCVICSGAAQWNSVQSVCDSYSTLQHLFIHTGKCCLCPLNPGEERQHPRGAVVKYLLIFVVGGYLACLLSVQGFCRKGH